MPSTTALRDVIAQFHSLNRRGERLAVGHGFPNLFSDKRYTVRHSHGGRNNHFQGVQRLGQHLLVTGSFPYAKRRADLLVLRMGSRPAGPGPWGSNLLVHPAPPPADHLVTYFQLDSEYWHPGGFALLDETAVIPLENAAGASKIVFVDLALPATPQLVPAWTIPRPGWKAGACAVTRSLSGQLLLAVWSDSDRPPPGGAAPRYHLDLYASRGPVLGAGFDLVGQFFPDEGTEFHHKWQSIDFLWEEGTTGSRLFLLAFENTHDVQPHPTNPGTNRGCLFGVDLTNLPNQQPAAGPARQPAKFLQPAGCVVFDPDGHWCNMDAGAGAYVNRNRQLVVYSVFHFLEQIGGTATWPDPVLRCLEFRATDGGSTDQVEDGWVDLYDEGGLLGRRVGLTYTDILTLGATALAPAGGGAFTSVRSLRFQLPASSALVLYPEPGFAGSPALVLPGGGIRDVNVLATGFAGLVRSCRVEERLAALAHPGVLTG